MSRLFVIQFQSLYTSTSSVSIEANDFEGKEVQQSGRLTERKKRREGEGGERVEDEICCSADELQLLASSRSASYY